MLKTAGLVPVVTVEPTPSADLGGKVLRQRPAAGDRRGAQAMIFLIVGEATEPTAPPVSPPVGPEPPVEPPVMPPVEPPVMPPVEPPVMPPVEPPVMPPSNRR